MQMNCILLLKVNNSIGIYASYDKYSFGFMSNGIATAQQFSHTSLVSPWFKKGSWWLFDDFHCWTSVVWAARV